MLAGFLVALFPLIATPGASLALLMRGVAEGGHLRSFPVILGTVTGLYVHAALAVAGLSAVVMRSSEAFTVVRLAGAAYLIGLGLWTWRSARKGGPGERGDVRRERGDVRRARARSPYVQALLANVLNPKAASVYLTLAPQFVTPHEPLGPQFLVLATGHAALVAAWLLVWALVLHRTGAALGRLAARISAAVLIGLGVRAAATT